MVQFFKNCSVWCFSFVTLFNLQGTRLIGGALIEYQTSSRLSRTFFKVFRLSICSSDHSQGKATVLRLSLVLALPIFPGRCQPSIVGRNELNYRVRNGNGWTLILINTNSSSVFPENMLIIRHLKAFVKRKNGDPYRIRTDVNGVRGRCLNHLTNGPLVHLRGLEPRTH